MNNIFDDLLNKYLLEKITKEETKQFFSLLDMPEYQELLKEHIGRDFLGNTYDEREDLVRRERVKQKLSALRTDNKKTFRLFTMRRIAAAAAVLLLLSTGAYFLLNNKTTLRQAQGDITQQKNINNDVAPGGNKAILTLADGSQIILDSAANGTLTQQGNTKIIKLDSGQLAYNSLNEKQGEGLYNTISTPKGGQYQIVLADGSKVWLNAASSLHFPTSFTGKERNVELTGEGYFEVAHDATKPFKVSVNGMNVQVLGTHFNINAYDDEDIIKTTLLEGSVKIMLTSSSPSERAGVRLKPGEQAVLTHDSQLTIHHPDIDEVIAWKNGMFNFKGADLATIMRQVSKWYDVDVVYEGKIPSGHYNGKSSRNLNASQMLKVLEKSGVKFSIEDVPGEKTRKRIIVKE